jgi:hypothetical protein
MTMAASFLLPVTSSAEMKPELASYYCARKYVKASMLTVTNMGHPSCISPQSAEHLGTGAESPIEQSGVNTFSSCSTNQGVAANVLTAPDREHMRKSSNIELHLYRQPYAWAPHRLHRHYESAPPRAAHYYGA